MLAQKIKQPVIAAFVLLSLSIAQAQDLFAEQVLDPDENTRFDEYYTVTEVPQAIVASPQFDPVFVLHESTGEWENFLHQARTALNLMSWDRHSAPLEEPSEKYSRRKHFGGWVVDREKGDCYNTRARVLIRDSLKPVQFSENNKCIVTKGEWRDPYTGLTFTTASDIQIDHFIPLKNAYINGAWRWDFNKRCLYANFYHNNFNLLPVSSHENQSKSDRNPAEYMPPNPQYKCEYLQRWLKAKLAWAMTLTPPEADAVRKLVRENNCNMGEFQLSPAELKAQRAQMESKANLCSGQF